MRSLFRVSHFSHLFGLLLVGTSLLVSAEGSRWYSEEQVAQGDKLFVENCAVCHGKEAQSIGDWRKLGADGKYPAPPLNGSAHAWHHPLNILKRTVRDGGIKTGGSMPEFKGKLSADEIDALIASFQARWSDEIYAKWDGINQPVKPKDVFSAVNSANSDTSSITKLLRETANGVLIGAPIKTVVPSIYMVKVGADYVYLTADGRYLFTGEVIDLKAKENLTQVAIAKDTKTLLDKFPEKDMVVFKANGQEKAKITVMTDVSCPFCTKLHNEIPSLLDAGVTVRYIAYPRAGLRGKVYEDMRSVWCAKDRLEAMSVAKGTKKGELTKVDCEAGKGVDAGFVFGNKIGVTGTPAIFLPDGGKIAGYRPANLLLQVLGLQSVVPVSK